MVNVGKNLLVTISRNVNFVFEKKLGGGLVLSR